MSPYEDPVPRIRLVANAPDEYTRIEVLDGNLEPIALEQNLGEVTLDLRPGVYAVRFQRGNKFQQKIAVLTPLSPATMISLTEDEAPHFATAVPCRKTTTSREFHRIPARDLSLSPPLSPPVGHAGGSHMLIFSRDLTDSRSGDPATGLTLHSVDGELLFTLSDVGEKDFTKGWSGVHLNLDPGPYRLRLQDPEKPDSFCEQIIYTCGGWQTQVFLLANEVASGGSKVHADLSKASVFMSRPDRGFDFERHDGRWTEVALRALQSKDGIPGAIRTDMLWAKDQNPMLGIYAGLLHFRREKIIPEMMKEVFFNLMNLIGPLPDVLAIGWAIAIREERVRADAAFMQRIKGSSMLATPPMLCESWEHLVMATTLEPQLIPTGSLSDRIAGTITSARPWLSWHGDPQLIEIDSPPSHPPKGFMAVFGPEGAFANLFSAVSLGVGLLPLANLLRQRSEAGRLLYSERFTPLERRVARYVYPLIDQTLRDVIESNPRLKAGLGALMPDQRTNVQELIKDLNVPAVAALRAAWGLFRKLLFQPIFPLQWHLEQFVRSECRNNPALESALDSLRNRTTDLRHKGSGQSVNGLEFLYMRYRGRLDPSDPRPWGAARLAAMLNTADYGYGRAGETIGERKIGLTLGKIREELTSELSTLVQDGQIVLEPNWEQQTLPTPQRYKEGTLLPEPHES